MKTRPSQPFKSGYISTLDGWRAIAVLSVIAYHDQVHRMGRLSDATLHRHGNLGVDLFFAISGILICSRLLDEEHLHHRISLKNFYVRRFCRILPPALLFLFILGVLGMAHVVRVGLAPWVCSLLFANNYYAVFIKNADASLYTNHFWSLAIEEHFYLILPGILYLFHKNRVRVLLSMIVVFLVYMLMIHANPAWLDCMGGVFADIRTELRINSLLFPALLAILLRKQAFREFCVRWITPVPTLVVLGIASLLLKKLHLGLSELVVVPFGFPFIVISTMLHPKIYLSRLLEIAPLRFLGRISYSIYLWQQMFFIGDHFSFRAAWPLSILQAWPWNVVAVILLATTSFYLVEKPFIRLGHRLAPPATPGRADLNESPQHPT